MTTNDLAELSETAQPDVDTSVSEENVNEQGEVSLEDVSDSENQVSEATTEDSDTSNS